MNIKQSNPLTNFYRPTGIPNKTNSNVDNADNTNSVFNTELTKSVLIRLPTEEEKETRIGGGGMNNITYELSYAENSTDENPIINAKVREDNGYGKEINQTININDIDPQNATVIELRALLAHANQIKPLDPSELLTLSTIGYEHGLQGTSGKPIHDMGLHDRFNPIASLETMKERYSGSPIQDMQDSVDSIIALLGKLSKFGKNGDNNIKTISNSVDEVVDNIATSIVDQLSKPSQFKKS